MLIDWFTVGAQTLNFLILVWLMKRFLYAPILHAIDAREKRIADELADAEARRTDAKKERDEFQHKNKVFDEERAALVSKTKEDAEKQRAQLLSDARSAADDLGKKRKEALREEAAQLNKALTRRTQDEVFSITRKVLSDLADVDLEERATTVFISQLRAMEAETKSGFGKALKSSTEPAIVRSAFELSDERREKVRNAIRKTFTSDLPLQFEIDPDLVSGIELTVSGNKVAWSIADYLKSLEKGVGELLKGKSKVEVEPLRNLNAES